MLQIITPANKYMKALHYCHSGLSGIFLCFQKDSRRASLAGMTPLMFLIAEILIILAGFLKKAMLEYSSVLL
jgi:hypothetical protein